jgi:hypothetical protein
MRCVLLAAAAAGVAGASFGFSSAEAASLSRITCKGQPSGAKSISPETISTPGDGQTPLGIVRILSAQLRIQDPVANGLMVFKSTLDNMEAFGQGLPNGYTGGGPLNPSGPWQGVLWPYRDFADGYVPTTGGTTPGNDIGRIADLGGGNFLVEGINGAMSFNTSMPASYMRGIPGNGVNDFARYFAVDLLSTVPIERNVLVTLENVEVQVLVRDDMTGGLSVVNQRTADVNLSVNIPAPGSIAVLLGLVPMARRRRRA